MTATAKPSTADYTTSLTLPAVPDPRLEPLALGEGVQVTIDSFGGMPAATKLFCTAEVNGVERLTTVELTTVGGGSNFAAAAAPASFKVGTANDVKLFL